MSTYTDLHNRVKENIVVGYKPDDRITTQKVKFYNEENEYWGTFSGTLRANNIDIAGGTLSNVHIVDADLSNVKWPGGVDFERYGVMIERLSTDVDGILDDKIPLLHRNIGDEAVERARMDAVLEERINDQQGDFRRGLVALCAHLTHQDDVLSTKLSVDVNTRINELSAASLENDRILSSEINRLCSELSSDLKAKFIQLSADDAFLSGAIEDLCADLERDLGREVYDRVVADAKLQEYADSISAASETQDHEIEAALQQHVNDNIEQFADLSSTVKAKIEHDRHYVIFDGSEPMETSPFKAKDMAVNVYTPVIQDGKVYLDKAGTQIDVGTIKKSTTDLLPLTLTTYKDIKDFGITSALLENWAYTFDAGTKTQPTQANGYSIVFNDQAYSESNQLSDCKFELKPTVAEFHNMKWGGVNSGMRVYDADPSGETPNIISGRLWIDSQDSEFEIFNKFNKMPFNSQSLSVMEKETERITYLGNNEFEFKKYIDLLEYVGVYDELGLDHEQFGRIYKKYNGISGVISSDGPQIEEINMMLKKPYSRNIKMSRVNGFRNEVQTDVPLGDGVFADYILSAGVDQMSADFDFVRATELYKYDICGANEHGEIVAVGSVTPKLYNKTLTESNDFSIISADISQVMWIDEFKTVFELTKVAEESLWTMEKTDSAGNVLNLKFNGLELFIKVTTSTTGQIVRQKYAVKLDAPAIANPDSCYLPLDHSHVYDLSKFDDQVEEAAATYQIIADAWTNHDDFSRYTLNIDDQHNDELKIEVPARTSDDISREFMALFNIKSAADKFIKVSLVKADGCGVTVYNLDSGTDDIYVKTNTWTYLQFNEVKGNRFAVYDLAKSLDGHFIEELKKMILAEKAARAEADAEISGIVELSVADLQNQILSNDADIADIYEKIKGGLNYKGVVHCQGIDSGSHIEDVPAVSNLFYWEGHTPAANPDYTPDTVLSSGFMYYVGKLDSAEAKTHFIIEGVEIEVGDYVVVNCHDLAGKAISDLTSVDIDVIDAVDEADVAYLSSKIDELSLGISSTVDAKFFHLSGDNQISGNNIFAGIDTFEEVNASVLSAVRLSADIVEAVNISADDVVSKTMLVTDKIEGADADFINLTAGNSDISLAKAIEASIVKLEVTDSAAIADLSIAKADADVLSAAALSADAEYVKEAEIENAVLSSAEIDSLSVESIEITSAKLTYLSAEEAVVADEVVSNLSIESLNQLSILDKKVMPDPYHPEHVTYISTLQDVLDLSSKTLTDTIEAVSTDLSSEIGGLSTSLSDDINSLSTRLSNDIDALSSSLSNDIDSLSSALSNDIDALSTSLSSTAELCVENLQAQIAANDADIETLCSRQIEISGDLSTVSADLDALEETLFTDTDDHKKTLSNDILLIHDYTDGEGHLVTKSVLVNQLVMVDEVTFDRYRLTIRNGSLNINKIDNILD